MLFTPLVTCCLVLGLALGMLLDTPPASIAGLTAAAALVTAAASVRLGLAVVPALLGGLALACAGLVHGAQAVTNAERPPLARWLEARLPDGLSARLDEPVMVEGWLLRDAAPSATGISLTLAVVRVARLGGAWEDTRGGIAVTVGGALDAVALVTWRGGRRVRLPVSLRHPTAYLDHGVPDGARALARRGTALVGSTKSAALVEMIEQGSVVDEASAGVRASVRAAMRRYVAPFDPVSADIATAILIGDRTQLDPELERQLQEAGTYHVVAISGGNIAVLAGTLLGMLWIAGVRFGTAALLTALLLVAHAWIIGGGASVVRATAMAVTYLALRVVDQRTSPAHALSVAAAVMLVANPLELANAGFWLTFGATGALLLMSVAWRGGARWWHAPVTIVAGSLVVELLLVPVSAYVFQRVTLAGLVLNLGAVPAMASVQMAASLCVLADALDFTRVASIAGWGAHVAAQALTGSSALVERVPWATWRVPSPSPFVLLAYYASIAATLAAGWLSSSRISRMVPGIIALVLLLWIAIAPQTLARRHGDGRLHITAWDVGQGDALLVTFPNG
ncbi:MAG: ComEC/Rec2 family competence protein, partial [Acidobacteria bacterium]|nr:ComEC/Rec2 family competence protein [Acidobacteriota bacterium]